MRAVYKKTGLYSSNIKVIKAERLKKDSILKETKETWEQKATHEPDLDAEPKTFSFAIRGVTGTTGESFLRPLG